MNKHHKQRIILFICSPIDDEQKDIIKIAKKLKKEKVNIGTVHSHIKVLNISKWIKIILATLSVLECVAPSRMNLKRYRLIWRG